jgi:16S rRNA (adenine1518-N6/adenine1519-N6)-dimethyltransferase
MADNDQTGPRTSPRQTLSYLRNLFAARGIHPKNKLGQNFLIDLNVLDLLVRAAELSRDDLIIEVGSGTGSLTTRLADQARAVLSVEIDQDFFELTRETTAGLANVYLFNGDILKNKNEINPQILSALEEVKGRSGCDPRSDRPCVLKFVANLPYAVAVPVISNFLLMDLSFECMVVTVQWEIAERLLARPDTKDYGALAVLVQSLADVALVRRLAPSVFWPKPQVVSAIVLIRPSPAKRAHVGDVSRFRNFLRDLYSHRRKNLRGALAGLPSGRRDKAEVDRKLVELQLPGTIRAEDLDIEQHLRLCEVFGRNDEKNSAGNKRA